MPTQHIVPRTAARSACACQGANTHRISLPETTPRPGITPVRTARDTALPKRRHRAFCCVRAVRASAASNLVPSIRHPHHSTLSKLTSPASLTPVAAHGTATTSSTPLLQLHTTLCVFAQPHRPNPIHPTDFIAPQSSPRPNHSTLTAPHSPHRNHCTPCTATHSAAPGSPPVADATVPEPYTYDQTAIRRAFKLAEPARARRPTRYTRYHGKPYRGTGQRCIRRWTVPARQSRPVPISSEALADSTIGAVGPHPAHDNHTVALYGCVTVREQDQGTESGRRCVRYAGSRAVWLIASSHEERDVWLLMLRARVAPVKLWHGACCTRGPTCGTQSHARLRSLSYERSTEVSQREIADALRSERSRWARDNRSGPEQRALTYGEGTVDDVSDAALLLCTSVMLVMELSTRVGAAASMNQFDEWHEGTAALCSIEDSSKVVCTAVHVVVSAAMAGVRGTSMSSVVDALMGCWDCLLVVESSLLETSSTRTITDDAKESLHEVERALHEHATRANVAQLAVTPQPTSTQDGAYQASFRVNIPCSDAAAKGGSPQYERTIEELLNTDVTDDSRAVAVTSVSGEGGAGNTTTCVLALRDARIKAEYKDGVFAIEVGLDAQEKDMIRKVADIVEDCQGTATAREISALTDLKDAAGKAKRFFRGRRILLFLDNVWPENSFLGHMMKIADARGSRVLFTTRSASLAQAFTTRVVSLGTLNLEYADERRAAVCILREHLRGHRGNAWCTDANVEDALQLSKGLPLAIATLAALIRNKLVKGVTTDVLTQVRQKMASPSGSDAYGLEHGGLFPAMKETLDLLDQRHAQKAEATSGGAGVMTQRFAALHGLDRSEYWVTKYVLSYHWKVDAATAEAIAEELFDLGLVTYAVPGVQAPTDKLTGGGLRTLTLHDLQAEYSAHLAKSGSTGTSVEEMHDTAVRGMLGSDGDIDLLSADDIVDRCEELCQTDENSDDLGGRYVVLNLMRHLVGSLTLQNAPQRWATILRLLSDAYWLFMWQLVDGWQHVYNQYIMIADKLPSTEILESLPRGEVEIVSEIGRAAREVLCKERVFFERHETEEANADLFRRVHAMWREESGDAALTLIERMLRSLYMAAGEWWLRPLTACHGRAAAHDALLLQFRVPQALGCTLVGDNGYMAVTSIDNSVRLFNKNGMLAGSHHAHSMVVEAVCVGHGSCDVHHRLFSVSEDGTLVLWDVTLPNSAVGHMRASDPVVVDEVGEPLLAVACASAGRVIVAGGHKGVVYLWILNVEGVSNKYSRRMLACEHTNCIRSVSISPDGVTVISGSVDRTCRVWRVADAVGDEPGAEPFAVLKNESGEDDRGEQVWSCTFADEGRVVVTGHYGGAVKIWRVGRDTPLHEVKLGEFAVFSLAAIGDAGHEVVAGTDTGTAHVVRVRDGAVTAGIGRADFDTVRGVSASRGSERVVACAHDSGRVELWDLERLSAEAEADASTPGRENQPQRPSRVYSVSSSPCGRVVASGHENGWVRCWSGRSGRCMWEYEHGSGVFCVCVSADAAHIACACDYGAVVVLDARNGSIVYRWDHEYDVFSVSLHKLSDGLVWSGHWNGEVVVWSVSQDSPAHMRAEHDTRVDNLSVSADGLSAYAQDVSGRISRLRIVDDGVEVEQVAPPSEEPDYWRPNGALFAELTAHGHRTVGHWRRHARVRHELGGETHDVSVRFAGHLCGVDVDLEIPNSAHVIRCIADFDSVVYTLDVAVSLGVDEGRSFAQIVCGFFDGRVCILRQPLTRGSEAYDAVESWERYAVE